MQQDLGFVFLSSEPRKSLKGKGESAHLCVESQCELESAHIHVKYAHGDVMSIKGALGFCMCPGCMKRAKHILEVKNIVTQKTRKVLVCDDCLWEMYS